MLLTKGMKSSEFWVTLAAVVGLAAASIQGSLPARWGAIASVIATAAYAVSRGLAKNQPVPADVPTVTVPASSVTVTSSGVAGPSGTATASSASTPLAG